MKQLIFSIDQGFANGVTNAHDFIAVERITNTLSSLRAKYNVCVGLTLTNSSWQLSAQMMQHLASIGMPFVLDVISSDVLTIGLNTWHAPYDISHGVAQPIQVMYWILESPFASYLKGFRIHEISAQAHNIEAMQSGQIPWNAQYAHLIPPTGDDWFQLKKIEPFVAFAKQYRIPLYWSDNYWSGLDPTNAAQVHRNNIIKDLTNAYPGAIAPMFANNAVTNSAQAVYWNWLQASITPNSLGWGLSNQSWSINDPTILSQWAVGAVQANALAVQFEPVWFWFNLPIGNVTDPTTANYVNDPQWANRGSSLPSLQILINHLH